MRPFLPDLPSVEAIKATPARFNVSLSDMTATPSSEIKQRYPPERLVGQINAIGNLPASEEKEAMAGEQEKVRAAEQQLEDQPQSDLRLRLNDIVGSHRALASKRKQIADL